MDVTYIALACGESMVNARGQDDQVVLGVDYGISKPRITQAMDISLAAEPHNINTITYLLQVDPYPLIVAAADVKVAGAVTDVADLLVLVQVLGEEALDLLLVDVAHLLGAHGDLVAVAVPPLLGQLVHRRQRRVPRVGHAHGGQLSLAQGAAAIVGEALIALVIVVAMIRKGGTKPGDA